MDFRYIAERLSAIRKEIRDLGDLNVKYWAHSEHPATEKAAYQERQLRLSQIKQELAIMMKHSGQ